MSYNSISHIPVKSSKANVEMCQQTMARYNEELYWFACSPSASAIQLVIDNVLLTLPGELCSL